MSERQARIQEVTDNMRAAQDFNPRNYDDAEYALGHPSEYSADVLAICQTTSDAAWDADGTFLL